MAYKNLNTLDYFPPSAFYFTVKIDGMSAEADSAFLEVSGLEVSIETEEIQEGGVLYPHRVPKKVKYSNAVILKRGFVVNMNLINWCKEAMQNSLVVKPRDISISLDSEDGQPLMTWNLKKAYPVKWSVSPFNGQQNAIVIETLELVYQSFTVGQ